MIRIIYGPPCAGKTSFIEKHAAPGDVRLDWDKLAEAIDAHPTGAHTARDGAVRAVTSYGRVVIGHYLRTKWKAETDNGGEATGWVPVSSPDAVGGFEDWIAAGARITVLDPGETECLRRCEADGRPKGTEDAIRQWYEDRLEVPDTWIYQDDDVKGAPTMRAKNLDVKVKAVAGEATAENPFGGALEEGDFIAYASTFDEDPDSYGDIVVKGAFTRTLDEWALKDAPIPLLFGHRMDDPAFNIGHIVDATEDEKGLLVWGRIDLETEKGQQAHRLVKSRRVNQLSFAFDVNDFEAIKDESGEPTGGLLLKDLTLHEVSLVQLGANRHTSVLAVKSAAEAVTTVKGEFTAEETEGLQDAVENLRDALAYLEGLLDTSDEDEAEDNENNQPGTDEDAREPAEPTEPKGSVSARAAAASLALALTL